MKGFKNVYVTKVIGTLLATIMILISSYNCVEAYDIFNIVELKTVIEKVNMNTNDSQNIYC